jgi:hypothetical protein
VKDEISKVIKTLVYGTIAASAGAVAFLFAVIAVFLWVQQRYDTIVAAGVVGGMFLLVAVIALMSLIVARRRIAERKAREAAEAARAAPGWLSDPALLLTAFQIARTIGFGKVIPIALAGLAAFGAAGVIGRDAKNRRSPEGETKRAA